MFKTKLLEERGIYAMHKCRVLLTFLLTGVLIFNIIYAKEEGMLTGDFKRILDNARDILVGKIPDPAAQIKQITAALIYKALSDTASPLQKPEEFSHTAKSKYCWQNLISTDENSCIDLYKEALSQIAAAGKISSIFTDIFKSIDIPYNDGNILKRFLLEIDKLTYNNTENLGNAFEYLLSLMGVQGAAGQFRTPSHIIDFIVDIIAPQPEESILDPACGTAGFLIGACKYLKNSTAHAGNKFTGYDISPEMVQLARINMYFHGFLEPDIYEYDTLSNTTRWTDKYDVILANPPFMTQRGGIIPHSLFDIKAARAEVLFVDYVMEHLTENGRAAIIVPEGIVFQSSKYFRQLREKLIKHNYLYAVVSLPSGVFLPYSNVKTSILFLDKKLAEMYDKILFVDIKNDGYELNSQRKQINKNDLPEAAQIIKNLQKNLTVPANCIQAASTTVPKSEIINSTEYNLTARRYKEICKYSTCRWELVRVDEICKLKRGHVLSKNSISAASGEYPVYSSQTTNGGILGYINSYDFDGEYVTWTTDGANAGTFFFRKGKFSCTNVCGILEAIDKSIINMEYLAHILNTVAGDYVVSCGNSKLMKKDVARIKIPLPPLNIQAQIARKIRTETAKIKKYTQKIDTLKKDIENSINSVWQ